MNAYSDFRALIKACTQGNVTAVRKLLKQGISVNETSEDGESLLSLACSAGYYELAQVLIKLKCNKSVPEIGLEKKKRWFVECANISLKVFSQYLYFKFIIRENNVSLLSNRSYWPCMPAWKIEALKEIVRL